MAGALEDSSEKIILRKADKALLEGEVSEVEGPEMGGVYRKSRVSGRLRLPESGQEVSGRKLKLVIKDVSCYIGGLSLFGDEQESMSPARRYYERWRFLRSIGVPTAGSMRVIDDRRVAMGDMTARGAVFFGKEKLRSVMQESERHVLRKLSKHEKVFLDIDPEEIKQKIAWLQALAWLHDFRLPSDDEYDILVWPDGTFQVLILDLTQMRRIRRGEAESDLVKERDSMFAYLDRMVSDLKKIDGRIESS